MSKKMYNLIVGVTGGIATIATAVVTYFNPTYAVQTVAAIGVGETAVIEIVSLFVKKEEEK